MGLSIRDIDPQCTFSSAVTVEALSQSIPADAITRVIAQEGVQEIRERRLTAALTIWLVIALHLFPSVSMAGVVRKLAVSQYFATVEEPHIDRTKIITLCAVICGADGWVAVEEFGNTKRAWLETFLALPNGIPSHDTLGRVFARIDPEQFQHNFLQWVHALQ